MPKGGHRSEPLPGRCNAQTASGYCHSYPKAPATRCRLHGGVPQTWAARNKALDTAAQAELDARLEDPDLLDVRRGVALSDLVISRTPILPSDETVRKLASRRILADLSPLQIEALFTNERGMDLLEPTEADLDAVRLQLHERSMRMIESYAKLQANAVKQLEWSKVIREAALPLLGEIGLRISGVLRRYVPEEKIPDAIEDVRTAIRQAVGSLALLRDDK